MIWSIISESEIFDDKTKSEELQLISYMGKQVLVRNSLNGKGEIVSLLSTDPVDFLSPNFSPGSLIDIR